MKKIVLIAPLSMLINTSYAESFKRFSVSAGWLHVIPNGSANPFNISTLALQSGRFGVGAISPKTFMNSVDLAKIDGDATAKAQALFNSEPNEPGEKFVPPNSYSKTLDMLLVTKVDGKTVADSSGLLDDTSGKLIPAATGSVGIRGIENWTQQGTGLVAEKIDTLGLVIGYYLTDQVSLQMIGGIPPRVDIQGKGEIIAPMKGTAYLTDHRVAPYIGREVLIKEDIPITKLGNKPTVSRARAWTPSFEVQYQFGKTGVNKFRPFVGAGFMYAHYNQIKVHHEVRKDLISAGHRIQNILDGKAGASLENIKSSGDPYVRVKAEDSIAPIATLGFTYDLNQSWYVTASVSYAKLNNLVKVDVVNSRDGNRLIRSTTRIDVDPILTYAGVGYRF